MEFHAKIAFTLFKIHDHLPVADFVNKIVIAVVVLKARGLRQDSIRRHEQRDVFA